MSTDEEKALLKCIQSDSRQFGILFDHFYKPIFGYIYRRVLIYELARDIGAETFLKAYLKIGKFEWKGIPLSAWLYKIATNEVNYYFRKRKYAPLKLESILDYDLVNLRSQESWEEERGKLDEELKGHRDFILIQEKLKLLDTKYQEVIALRYFENKENKEISMILDKPEGTIKSLLSRGLEKLRRLVIPQ